MGQQPRRRAPRASPVRERRARGERHDRRQRHVQRQVHVLARLRRLRDGHRDDVRGLGARLLPVPAPPVLRPVRVEGEGRDELDDERDVQRRRDHAREQRVRGRLAAHGFPRRGPIFRRRRLRPRRRRLLMVRGEQEDREPDLAPELRDGRADLRHEEEGVQAPEPVRRDAERGVSLPVRGAVRVQRRDALPALQPRRVRQRPVQGQVLLLLLLGPRTGRSGGPSWARGRAGGALDVRGAAFGFRRRDEFAPAARPRRPSTAQGLGRTTGAGVIVPPRAAPRAGYCAESSRFHHHHNAHHPAPPARSRRGSGGGTLTDGGAPPSPRVATRLASPRARTGF